MKPKYSTNSGVFAKRGDPWVSDRQGLEEFGRVLETEDPDFDAMVRAKKAVPKAPYVDPKPAPRVNDFQRQKTNAILAMRRNIRQAENNPVSIEAANRPFRPCPGCRKAVCIAKGACQAF